MTKSKAKVNFIVKADRVHGHGSVTKAPPQRLKGKIVNIYRSLINWHGHFCYYKGKRYLFSHAELNLIDCDCRDCQEVKALNE